MRVNADQSQHSSTFVNFFRGWHQGFPLIPLGKSGMRHRSYQRPEEKPHSPFFPCLCRNMEEGDDFRESRNVHFRHLHAKGVDAAPRVREGTGFGPSGNGHTFRYSNKEKAFWLPLSPLTLKEATS